MSQPVELSLRAVRRKKMVKSFSIPSLEFDAPAVAYAAAHPVCPATEIVNFPLSTAAISIGRRIRVYENPFPVDFPDQNRNELVNPACFWDCSITIHTRSSEIGKTEIVTFRIEKVTINGQIQPNHHLEGRTSSLGVHDDQPNWTVELL